MHKRIKYGDQVFYAEDPQRLIHTVVHVIRFPKPGYVILEDGENRRHICHELSKLRQIKNPLTT